MTIPFKLIKEIHENTVARAETKTLTPIEYKELGELPWAEYDIEHELTTKGLAKFAADWNALCE
jgi:transaldolase